MTSVGLTRVQCSERPASEYHSGSCLKRGGFGSLFLWLRRNVVIMNLYDLLCAAFHLVDGRGIVWGFAG